MHESERENEETITFKNPNIEPGTGNNIKINSYILFLRWILAIIIILTIFKILIKIPAERSMLLFCFAKVAVPQPPLTLINEKLFVDILEDETFDPK